MLALANRANDQGRCWPGLNRLAKDSGLSRRTVTRCLPRIEATGELLIERRGLVTSTDGGPQAINLYTITITPAKGSDRQSLPSSGKVGTRRPQGRDTQSPKVETDSPKGRDSLTPESSGNHQYEPSENRKSRATGLPGHGIDYQKAEPPNVGDYGGDGYAMIAECPDPILAAMAVTGERGKKGWGRWVKVLNRARNDYGRDRAERLFRTCVEETWGEKNAREIRNPGAILNIKLNNVLRPL